MSYENFVRVEPMTDEARRKIYEQLPKERLIDMLIQCNKIIENMPTTPFVYDCRDWEHCGNPHRDCFNCPLQNVITYSAMSASTIIADDYETISIDNMDETIRVI